APQAIKRIVPALLEAVASGLAAEPPGKPRGSRPRNGKPQQGQPPPEVVERYERLRAWRKVRAEARKIEVQVIVPNAVLMAVAVKAPQSLGELAAVEGMDDFRLQSYGGEMLTALKAPLAPQPSQQELLKL